MLGFFPTPAHDELLFSLVGRFAIMSGASSQWALRKQLFGKGSRVTNIDRPGNLQHFAYLIPGASNHFSVNNLIELHTTFPYFQPFLTSKKANVLKDEMTFGGRAAHYGCNSLTAKASRGILCCTVCFEEDLEDVGMPTWKRAHQLPGVLVCPWHGEPLSVSDVVRNRRHAGAVGFQTLDRSILERAETVSVAPSEHEALLRVAEDTSWLLESALPSAESEVRTTAVLRLLRECGFCRANGTPKRSELLKVVVGHFGSDRLEKLGCGLCRDGTPDTWLSSLWRHDRFSHPLGYLLLLTALGLRVQDMATAQRMGANLARSQPDRPNIVDISTRSLLCANPACEEYAADFAAKLAKMPDVHQRYVPQCPRCGFSYKWDRQWPRFIRVNHACESWDNYLRYRLVGRRNSLREASPIFHLSPTEIASQATRAGIKRQKKLPGFRAGDDEHARRLGYRAWWKARSLAYPNHSLARIGRHHPTAYAWLREHDAVWLNENKTKILQTKEASTLWEKKDQELLDVAKSLVETRFAEQWPKKISIYSILFAMGDTQLLRSIYHTRLPRLREYLRAAAETSAAYRQRIAAYRSG